MNKLAIFNVPFGGFESEELVDGYYRIEMPLGSISDQIPSSWAASPGLHDGNPSAGYRTGDQGLSGARIAVLAAKEMGMAMDSVDFQQGYANAAGMEDLQGANSVAGPWSPLDFGAVTGMVDHLGVFSYVSGNASGASGIPYRYLALILADSGGLNNEVGCGDLRWKAAGVDIGP